ncbi:putative ATP-dependent helicase C23E6.02 [Hypsizygus marmoreus]|uniref:ATP-dependent helicase C23E6.02 n=1 Tax=Hypsizygus marmoreus TaxID=39966 RepID=A0A369J634_HYPMA|nr:putative ATP-dependent helicase C23E6.02 [Hypsizygus marmoreus]
MEPMTPEKLAAVAKTHLGYRDSASDSVVPNAYMQELRKHHLLYPHDLNFRVTLDPGRSYGRVCCLEKGCDALVIPLVARTSSRDGGLREGLGSLSAYRFHIESHPTHAKNRLARVKAELAVKKGGVAGTGTTRVTTIPVAVKKEGSGLLSALDSNPFGASISKPRVFGGTSTPTQPQPTKRTSSLVRVKAEAPEPKLFPSHLSPLAAALFSSQAPGSSAAAYTPPVKRTSSLVRVKPEAAEPQLPKKRLSDVAFGAVQSGVQQTLPLTVKRPKVEPTAKKPLSQVNRNTGSSENVLAAPSAESVEDIRAKLVDVQREISLYESSLNALASKRRLTATDKRRLVSYNDKLNALRRQRDQHNAAIPNVSPLKRTQSRSKLNFAAKAEPSVANLGVLPMFNHHPAFAQAKQTQPVASGSNVRLPEVCGGASAYMDDEEDDLPAAVLQRIGPLIPAIAPLMNAGNFDANGDFFGRGRDTFVGPQAKADDIDKFLLEAGNAEQFDGNARVDQALEKLGLQTQYDLMPGMEVALMPHQTIGVAWMVEKEKSSLKGGCLGDDMGLGKTVQMIATIIKNKSEDPICKTNLIIAPMALLDQWKLEIEMKTNCGLKCLIYHGSSKPKRKQELLKYDVVLTTYSTMALEWPDLENEQKKKMKAKAKKNKPQDNFIAPDSDDDSDDPRPRKGRKEIGLLFQVDFYRIICDEAQAIRNRRTRTSRAITDLSGMYRWCLTGTPIINSLVDVYGYLRFLKIRPWYDFTEFQSHIGVLEKRNPTLAVSRLQTVITTFLLRRMKDSMLDGKRLIELPDKTVSLIKLEFSEEEREVYQMMEARTQANFNRYLRAGTVLKNYSQVLVLLLRLRQICSHPSLIQEGEAASIRPEEADDESSPTMTTELTRAQRLVSPEFVSKMKEKFKTAAIERMKAEKESADAVVDDEECPICFDALTDAVITPCTHIFCRDCLVDVLNTPIAMAADEPAKFKANERPCPACRSPICADRLFTRAAFMPSDSDLLPGADSSFDVEMADATASVKLHRGKGKARPKKRARRVVLDSDDVLLSEVPSEDEGDDDDDISDFIVEEGEDEEEKDARRKLKKRLGKRKAQVVLDSDEEIEDSPEEQEVLFGKKARVSPEAIKLMPKFLPSTKMKYMMERLAKLLEERPEEKTLVVSQWTGCLSLVSDYLAEKGVIHVKYQGDMNRAKRDQAVRVFMSKDKARVMLMSLKCGGVGLNLTRANNVISLDLGWSQAIEAQSFDRVHRLGQTRPVVVQRLVISDTVEDRVLAMQERKQQLADGSLGEGTGKKIGRLSVKELANLFGLDHRGRLLAHN